MKNVAPKFGKNKRHLNPSFLGFYFIKALIIALICILCFKCDPVTISETLKEIDSKYFFVRICIIYSSDHLHLSKCILDMGQFSFARQKC